MKKSINIGGQFSGVGAFDYALKRLSIDYNNIYQAEWDKFARQTYLHNHSEPVYYIQDVNDTPTEEITEKYGSLDIAMFSPPCQSFSLAGKRLGKNDKRGILFFNSLEFIDKNKPRFFIFENVKGLLSDNGGKTFSEWVNLLGGKTINGNTSLFPYADSVPYHLYWKVLNAKHHGVPQNRERVFLVGIRDDSDNVFSFPAEENLTKRLKDVLESEVDEKYFLSDKAIMHLDFHKEKHDEKGTGFGVELKDDNSIASTLRANGALCPTDNHIKVTSATSTGYEIATDGDSINLEFTESKTRRGRVGKGVAQTLDTGCNQGAMVGIAVHPLSKKLEFDGFKDTVSPTLLATDYKAPKCVQFENYKIRRLTPRECFRLMDFPDTFTWPVSDSQAYKQAGNSIVVNVLYKILKNLKTL